MSMESVAAVIVTYNPKSQIIGNVTAIAAQVNNVIVVDNGSSIGADPQLRELETQFGCKIIRNEQNLGVAKALNLGVKYAIELGCDWVCTLDQDSVVSPGFVSQMLTAYWRAPHPESVAIIAPTYIDRGSQEPVHLRRSTSGEILVTMTSGSMAPVSVIRKLGFFDEDLFIDGVDTEFCLRARMKGMVIVQSPAVLLHSLGRTTYHRFFGRHFSTTNYSPERHYYIFRNRTRLLVRYATAWPWAWREIRGAAFDIVKIGLVENDRWKKFRAMAVGVIDALSRKGGKRIEL